jgi:ankyrin repeat protein
MKEIHLFLACRDGYLDIVKLLILKGANIDQVNNHINAPIHIAHRNGNLEIVKLLILKGANIHIKDKDGYTPISIACRK